MITHPMTFVEKGKKKRTLRVILKSLPYLSETYFYSMYFAGNGSLAERVHSHRYRLLSSFRFFVAGLIISMMAIAGCGEPGADQSSVFVQLPASRTGISFQNQIREHEGFNVLEYEYFFNGGGVAIGDVDRDGLPDVYFTANMEQDQLYLNQGDLRFEDISASAGLLTEPGWTTGVTMADVDGDGWLDIYVCRSGQVSEERRRNLLYINNHDLTFTERAADFGLDDPSYSNHASFFDYDRDGDLDMYLLNHPIRRFSNFDVALMKQQRDPLAGDKLYRNDNGRFVDVSVEAGIIGNPLGFGLSAVVQDINQDGWPDLYVANDYIEEDYLYINQQDGTFAEEIRQRLTHASYSSMGTDIADLNNDGRPEIMTLDMLAEDHYRQKILKGPENHVFYNQMRERGIHEQYMRNMLQLNNGNGTYSEIGQLAGVSNTDWSWSVLLADFNNNSYKDIVVTNGYLRDYTDLDYLENTLAQAREASAMGRSFSSMDLVQQMPSTKLQNYVFSNEGGLRFQNQSDAWAFDSLSFSNGAAYGDLDLDGDLDLIINNINEDAFVFENTSAGKTDANYVRIVLEGPAGNAFGYGSRVEVEGANGLQSFYVSPGRGYLSSVEPVITAGLGAAETVSIHITWPDGRQQSVDQVRANQTMTLKHADSADPQPASTEKNQQLMYPLADNLGLDFVHREDAFDDFDREPLLPHMVSRLGPALAVADVNRDNLQDVFVGGASGQPGVLYLQQPDGNFARVPVPDFEKHAEFEDDDAVFVDVDGDRDLDLYVVSGGSHETEELSVYQDRLYLNNGFGAFNHAPGSLPVMPVSGAVVAQHDFDGDGDVDLFVGGGVVPGQYPASPQSYLLENEAGVFTDVTEAHFASAALGMVRDAVWVGDGDNLQLIVAGEWMPVRIFSVGEDRWEETTEAAGLARTAGWWNKLVAADLDNDGDVDLLGGNQGLNTQLKATSAAPLRIHAQDMDANGRPEFVISNFDGERRHAIYWREELVAQVPRWLNLFPDNRTYATSDFGLIEENIPSGGMVLDAEELATMLWAQEGGVYTASMSPRALNFGPVNDMVVGDLNGDGINDVIAAGNDYTTRPQLGPSNGGRGVVMLGAGGLQFEALQPVESGFYVPGDVRRLAVVQTANGPVLIVANNNGPLGLFAFAN